MNSFCVQNLEVLFSSYHEKKTSGNTSPRLLEESSNRSTLLTIHNTTSIINKCIKQDPEIFLISCLFRKSTQATIQEFQVSGRQFRKDLLTLTLTLPQDMFHKSSKRVPKRETEQPGDVR